MIFRQRINAIEIEFEKEDSIEDKRLAQAYFDLCLAHMKSLNIKLKKVDKLPIDMGEHWNCGICGCSHVTYIEARDCPHLG